MTFRTPTLAATSAALALAFAAPLAAHAEGLVHYGLTGPTTVAIPGAPPFSAAVRAGDTVYIAGTTDGGDRAAKAGEPPEASVKRVLEHFKAEVEAAGATMDDLTWVQVFCSDLTYYDAFNTAYRTYFKGPMPARAFIGADHLLGNAHFEMMGVAVTKAKAK